MQPTAIDELGVNQIDEGRLYEPTLVVPLLGPRIRKPDASLIKAVVRIAQPSSLQSGKNPAHTRRVNVDTYIILLRMLFCQGQEGLTIAEPHFQDTGGAAPEYALPVQSPIVVKTETAPERVERAALTRGQPAGP